MQNRFSSSSEEGGFLQSSNEIDETDMEITFKNPQIVERENDQR